MIFDQPEHTSSETTRARHFRSYACWSIAVVACVAACHGQGRKKGGPAPTTEVEAPGAPTENRAPIEMLSWWGRGDTGDDESNPVAAVVREHRKRYPKDEVITPRTDLLAQMTSVLRARMERGDPPETFQANIGMPVMQWVLINGFDARASKLVPLDDVMPETAEWRRALPARLVADLSLDGKMYGIASTIHRHNTILYNKNVFDKYHIQPPKSLEDFPVMARQLAGTGIPLIALGAREPWFIAMLAFECFLIAQDGAAFYEDYFRGKMSADDPRVLRALEKVIALLPFVNANYKDTTWFDAVGLVAQGRAGMIVMGDWALSTAKSRKLHQEYVEIAFPGAENTFVYTSDIFVLPVGVKNPKAAQRLLATIGSRDGQEALNRAKGSIAPRSDVTLPADANMAYKSSLLKTGTLMISLSGLVPPRFHQALGDAMLEMLEQQDIEPVVHTLRSRYALLR